MAWMRCSTAAPRPSMPSPTESYLAALRGSLRGNPLLARRVIEEVADHLAEAVAAARRSGMSEHDAEEDAVRRFGPPAQFAGQFDRFGLPFRFLLMFASIATIGVGLWLLWVIALVLPARDPAHIPMWRTVALCFFAYSGLSWAYLAVGPRHAALRWAVLLVSLGAIGLGLYGVVAMILQGLEGEHFEGYIVLMGLVLAGHGLSAFAYTLLTRRIEKQVRAGRAER